MPKSTWNGSIAFGLVSVQVSLFSAVRDQRISMKQLCPVHHSPISQRRICPGAPVPALPDGTPAQPAIEHEVEFADLVHGYTLGEEKVVFTTEELERAPVERIFKVTLCIPETELDPRYLDKPYVVGPRDASADRRYALLREALRRTGMIGIGKIALKNRVQLAALRVVNGLLLIQIMRWPDELVSMGEFADITEMDEQPLDGEVALAEQLVHTLSGSLASAGFKDEYQAALQKLIAARIKGEDKGPAPTEPKPEESGVADLLALLEASLAEKKAA
jgi:DNA end-binding protein Ku